ncbi:hypothetical protein OG394_02655 [Kribbella sp. NBC_01245]|uniref:TlpA family protein disulfide reductase n=1 Tax=Kribbella sp. NBC_01245 TaxID=2903578 RepID=UPI002E2DABC9|nr:hypothetical protein [Kribbella sp. NBC_01245]
MAFLTAAVILLGALVLLNLVITLGLVKRVRSHAEHLGQLVNQHQAEVANPGALEVGVQVGEFSAVSTEGTEISRDTFTDGAIIGFFSTWCDACEEHLPGFIAYAEPLGRDRVLAVVQGDGDGLADLTGRLAKVAQVVIEEGQGPIAEAVGVRGMPTMAVVDGGWRVVSSGFSAAMLTPTR